MAEGAGTGELPLQICLSTTVVLLVARIRSLMRIRIAKCQKTRWEIWDLALRALRGHPPPRLFARPS